MSFWEKIKADCHALTPNCREASRTQSDMIERPVSSSTRIGLWLHLVICKWCRRYGQQIRFLRTAAHEHPETLTEAAPEKLSATARERMKQQLRKRN